MSLNTIDNDKNSRPPHSRSLRTDDIDGAKPKSGIRKNQDAVAYSGLNLPSYSKQMPRSPRLKQEEITKNAANFFGSTPPVSPKMEGNFKQQDIDQKVLAKFYGATPPRSGARDPYSNDNRPNLFQGNSKEQLPQAEVAKFYGVTPLQSRGFSHEPLERNSKVNEKDLAAFFGVTPQVTTYKPAQASIPQKELANFFGATPPRSRQPDPLNNLPTSKPPRSGQSPLKYPSPPNISNKAAAAFYGSSPLMSRQGVPSKEAAAFFGSSPSDNISPSNFAQSPVFTKAEAGNFFGSTPENTRFPSKALRIPDNTFSTPSKPQVNISEAAKFFGVTPDVTGYKNENIFNSPTAKGNQGPSGLPAKDLANFYGATPPPSRSPVPGRGSMQGYAQNIFSTSGGKAGKVSDKDLANFYGVTPPPTGKVGGDRGREALNPKALANFYGATPPPSGKPVNYEQDANIFSDAAAKFFGSDPVAPEFQHAADLASKPKFNPYARHKNIHENTAARIFN
jgi:hypothetical protein